MASAGKKKIVILVVIVMLLLAIAGAAAWFLFLKKPATAVTALPADVVKKENIASFIPISEPFVFNVKGVSRDRLAQVSVQLEVRGDADYKLATDNLSVIESSIGKVFRSATTEELRLESGRKDLRRLALESIQAELVHITKKPVVEQILFTDFVMQ